MRGHSVDNDDIDRGDEVQCVSGEGVPRPPTRNSRVEPGDFDALVRISHTIDGSRNLCCALSLLGPDATTEDIVRLYDEGINQMDVLASEDEDGEEARGELREYTTIDNTRVATHAVFKVLATHRVFKSLFSLLRSRSYRLGLHRC